MSNHKRSHPSNGFSLFEKIRLLLLITLLWLVVSTLLKNMLVNQPSQIHSNTRENKTCQSNHVSQTSQITTYLPAILSAQQPQHGQSDQLSDVTVMPRVVLLRSWHKRHSSLSSAGYQTYSFRPSAMDRQHWVELELVWKFWWTLSLHLCILYCRKMPSNYIWIWCSTVSVCTRLDAGVFCCILLGSRPKRHVICNIKFSTRHTNDQPTQLLDDFPPKNSEVKFLITMAGLWMTQTYCRPPKHGSLELAENFVQLRNTD